MTKKLEEMDKAYQPSKYEDDIYKIWEESGFFNPDNLDTKGKSFTISMPPPNATGILHLGHAAALAYEDLMIRYRRLRGDKALWVPGTDHAGIATQTKVEKILAEEGTDKQSLGRDKFTARVKDYVINSQDIIRNQTRKMGSSCDWSRERYTFDEGLSRAVNEAFIRMYDDGLIERDYRIVNWCPRCESTLADDEVEHQEQDAKLYYIKYGPFVVATTRPETKLADTGVAVNPSDKRYKEYVGQTLEIDLAGHQIKVKVFADKEIDKAFGSGVVGVTPAHSATDYDFAQRHGLEVIKLINEQGKILKTGGKYVGQTVLEARENFVKDLEVAKQIEKIEDFKNNLSICYRCDTAIEPLTSEQWFIRVNKEIPGRGKSLKTLATLAIKNGDIKILPEKFNKIYYHWMDNLHDWCISRQIWWGHRIPVWYKSNDKFADLNITFFRHTQSKANALGVGGGHKDYELTDRGIKQAQKIAKEVNSDNFDIIFSSDLTRAKQTAVILFPGVDIKEDKRLREVDFGDLTGKKIDSIDKYRLKGFPNGENYQDVKTRVELFLNDIAKEAKGKKVALVAHSGIWKVLEIIFNGQGFTQEFLNIHAPLGSHNYSGTKDSIYVGAEKPEGDGWRQDEDTLDTWFSSSLWTFSTLGWPDQTKDLKNFHPTSVMETGYDIVFFWVARMIMMSEYILEDKPFETVYLHGMIRDKDGKKMSKSLGNGIDPLEMIDKFGTDALRLALIIGSTPGADMRLYEEKIAGYRNFVNKLWNISRFIFANVDEIKKIDKQPQAKTLTDHWILAKFNQVNQKVTEHLNNYRFSEAGEELYRFTWSDFADWYLEIAKIEKNKDKILLYILERLLILYHPFIPFVTEVIWQQFNGDKLLMIEEWPKSNKFKEDIILGFSNLQDLIIRLRNLKVENKISPTEFPDCYIKGINASHADLVAKMSRVKLKDKELDLKPIDINQFRVYINLKKELSDKEKQDIKKFIKTTEAKLADNNFINKAPEKVIKDTKKRLVEAKNKVNGEVREDGLDQKLK